MNESSTFSNSVFKSVVDFIWPSVCLNCDDYCTNVSLICDRCANQIDTIIDSLCIKCMSHQLSDFYCENCAKKTIPVFILAGYRKPMVEIIKQIKFHNVQKPVKYLVGRLYNSFESELKKITSDILLPIPLHPSREYQRGYNQAEIIAQELSKLIDIPVDTNCLYRTKNRKPQSRFHLDDKKRKTNIKNVFMVDIEKIKDLSVVLIDDVITTGATINEARQILEDYGCTVSAGIALAYARN